VDISPHPLRGKGEEGVKPLSRERERRDPLAERVGGEGRAMSLKSRARRLRVDQTPAERLLWGRLRNRRLDGLKWKRQVPREGFILDFLCVEHALAVELDGGQHAEFGGLARDDRRTAVLERDGLRLIRFWNAEVHENLDVVCDTILAVCYKRL
jgi:very-short-patch-repair endonuclease